MKLRPWILVALTTPGCLPREGGYPELGHTVSSRLGAQVSWHPAESRDDGATDATARELLHRPLAVPTAVRIALLNNRSLRAAMASLGVSAGALLDASLVPNPTAGASVQFPVGAGNGGRPLLIDFDASVDLRALFLLPARRASAEAAFEATRARAAGLAVDLAYHTEVAFQTYLAARQRVTVLETALETAGAAFEAARALHDAGNVPSLTVSMQEALYQDTRVMLADAENDATQRREQLNVLLGVAGTDTTWTTDATLAEPAGEIPAAETLEQRAVAQSLALEALAHEIESARGALSVARTTGVLPPFSGGVAAAQHDGIGYVGPSVRLGLPLANQGQGEVTARSAELRRAEAEEIATAVEVRAAVRAARAQLLFTQQRAVFYRDVQLPLHARIVQETVGQYNAMQRGVFEVLEARRAEVHVGEQYIAALRDYALARAAVTRLLAGGDAMPHEATHEGDER